MARRWLVLATAVLLVAGAVAVRALHDRSASPGRSYRPLADTAAATAASQLSPSTSAVASMPCAGASATTIANVDAEVAQRIYSGELHSREVSADIARIQGSRQLQSALASANPPAVYAAVRAIVYTPHWHIVRLRVVKNGRVLADVGGPDIIAPVSGSLSRNGRQLGSFVMSVQDDLGYVKLVSRFIGVPVNLYRGGTFLMGTLPATPAKLESGATTTIAGRTYQMRVLTPNAFPAGTLRAALLVPTPPRSVADRPCGAVRAAAWGSIATRVAARFTPLAAHYAAFVDTLQRVTGGLAFVRAGSKRLAGAAAPKRLPAGGTVRFEGRSWSVFSWVGNPPARIYLLSPSR
jgi:hypothetical protein